MTAKKDLKDKRYGRLTVIEDSGERKNKRIVWSCLCDCGNLVKTLGSSLLNGHTKSCGCLAKEAASLANITHGMSKSREYKAWKRIKNRCLNPANGDYETYSKLGMSENYKNDFQAFLDHIGLIPEEFKNSIVSVDRIDNNIGYFEGNIRWCDEKLQARNKSLNKNNKSGTCGVYKTSSGYWVAMWRDLEGRSMSRSFSIKKFGDEVAFSMACEERSLAIESLNQQGAGYSDNHGKLRG